MSDRADAIRVLRDHLGHLDAKPGQRAAIEAVLAGRDVLAIMPTGGGKSAIYQVGGAQIDGPTLVVSPLIALQHDQVRSLEEHPESDVGQPARLDSTMGVAERAAALDGLRTGDVEFMFLAPEQLQNPDTFATVAAATPSLVVIDEAHCVSVWGHDFRPAYAALGEVIDALGRPQTLALTATASAPVRDDIIALLGLREPVVVVAGFDRPNIHLSVSRHVEAVDRDRAVVAAATRWEGQGIVYVATRRRAEELARTIGTERPAAHYHGAMSRADRERAQRRFVDGGQDGADVMVATNAFGMGIDKPDVRWVVHADMPDSIDAYYQEVGRAGRDGDPAQAELFFRAEDVGRRRFHLSTGDARRAALNASRLEMMRSFAESDTCRRRLLLAYFGEALDTPCNACDVCDRDASAVPVRPKDDRFRTGTRVEHAAWGLGTILDSEERRLTVLFDDAGYKHLDPDVVTQQGLLWPASAHGRARDG